MVSACKPEPVHLFCVIQIIFQTQNHKQPFPWIVLLFSIQIFLLSVLLLIWAVKLVKRGKGLARSKRAEDADNLPEQPDGQIATNDILFFLAKDHLRAKLSHDVDEILKTKESLKTTLRAIHETLCEKHEEKEARRLLITIIRCTCVKHPYDQIGRRMASLAKTIYKEEILHQFGFFLKVTKYFSIPFFVRRSKWGQSVMMNIPILIATMTMLHKVVVYGYDIYTDAIVIDEIDQNIDNFKIPLLNSTELSFEVLRNFTLDKIGNKGVGTMKEPCEFLDLTEDVFDEHVPLYKMIVSQMGDVHWNPNKNTNHSLKDAFVLVSKILPIVRDKTLFNSIKTKRRTGDVLLDIAAAFDQTASNLKSKLGELTKISKLPLAEKISQRTKAAYEKSAYRNIDEVDLIQVFVNTFISIEEEDSKTVKKPRFAPLGSLEARERCRKVVRKLIQLFGHKDLEKVIRIWFEEEYTRSNTLAKNPNFMTKNIMKSVFYFLILTALWTLAIEVKHAVTNIYKSRQFPLLTTFLLVKNENDPNSQLFLRDPKDTGNGCVKMIADRHNSSIHEATHETLSAVNIQIALFLYMATFISLGDQVFKDSFGVKMPLNAGFETMTKFSSSAMMDSLLAGAVKAVSLLTLFHFDLRNCLSDFCPVQHLHDPTRPRC